MTKLSDALRGAADRAPVSDLSVSTDVAARRVNRQRGLRGAANGLVGIGAVTVLAVGIMAPGMGGGGADLGGAERGAADGGGDEAASFAQEDATGAMLADRCGSYPGVDGWGEPTVDLDARVEGLDPDAGEITEFEGGESLDLDVIVTALEDVNLSTTGPQVSVLWEGMLVGELLVSDTAIDPVALDEGDTQVTERDVALVNCWDGAPLPGGKYELVVTQHFYPAADAGEPTVNPEPVPEPTVAPNQSSEGSLGEDPDAPVSSGDSATDGSAVSGPADGVAPSGDGDGAGLEAIEPAPLPEPQFVDFQVVAPTVSIVVAGEVPDNPFEQYLPQPVELPDNYLTPDVARDLYAESLVTGEWDMAPGTQRWVMQSDGTIGYDDDMWQRNYYGCPWDDGGPRGFPTESSQMNLFTVDAELPSTINVSYGWVVDDNPLVSLAVRNESDYAIPGFYGEPSAELYLVRDGVVVAEAYPTSLRPYDEVAIMEEAIDPSFGDTFGLLDPGAELTGEYLWRDVSGCWTGQGGQTPVEPGTYTLVNAQGVYITDGAQQNYVYEEDLARSMDEGEAAMQGDEALVTDGDAATDSLIAPAWPQQDYVELRVWTSLGTVTVTTSN